MQLQDYLWEIENIVKFVLGVINVENLLRNNSIDLYFNINCDKVMMLGVLIYVIDKLIWSFVNGFIIGIY